MKGVRLRTFWVVMFRNDNCLNEDPFISYDRPCMTAILGNYVFELRTSLSEETAAHGWPLRQLVKFLAGTQQQFAPLGKSCIVHRKCSQQLFQGS